MTEQVEDVEPTLAEQPARPVRRGARTTLVAGAVVLALVAGGAGWAVLHDDGTASPASVPAARSAGRDVGPAGRAAARPAVQALLDRRAAAVRDRDLDAFLRDLDDESPAFVQQQRLLFANLTKFDFSTWRYELADEEFGAPDLGRRYHAPAFLQISVLRYALAGFDPAPVALAQAFTVVRRDGRWKLAADTDAGDRFTAGTYLEPWEGKPVSVARSGRAMVVMDQDADAEAVLPTIDRAVRRIDALWGRRWARKAVVVAVDDDFGIVSSYRPGLVPDDVAAVAIPMLDQPRTLHGVADSIGVASHRVAVLPDYVPEVGDATLITHELTHLATADVALSAPLWVSEGVAEWVGTHDQRADALALGSGVRAVLARGPMRLPTDAAFRGAEGAEAYGVAALTFRYVEQTYGRGRAQDLVARWDVEAGARADPDVRQERVLQRVLGTSTAELQSGVDRYVRSLLR